MLKCLLVGVITVQILIVMYIASFDIPSSIESTTILKMTNTSKFSWTKTYHQDYSTSKPPNHFSLASKNVFQSIASWLSSSIFVFFFLPNLEKSSTTTRAAPFFVAQPQQQQQHFANVIPSSKIINNKDEPPVVLRFRYHVNYSEVVPCDVPCHVWKSNGADFLCPMDIDEGTYHYTFESYTMEGAGFYKFLTVPPEIVMYNENQTKKENQNDDNHNNNYDYNTIQNNRTTFYATTSFDSDIPLPYYSPDIFHIQSPPIDFDSAIKGASYLVSSCRSKNSRQHIAGRLMQLWNISSSSSAQKKKKKKKHAMDTIRVYSLGQCSHNADPPNGVSIKNKTKIMQQYLFHLAFENQQYDDYITEKLWGSLESGTLPVYYGPKLSNLQKHYLPEKSIIFVDDFPTIKALGRYLHQLSQNKTLYETYHAWRYKPLPEPFLQKYAFTKVHSFCRTCRFIYAKRHNLGWNKQTQEIIRFSAVIA